MADLDQGVKRMALVSSHSPDCFSNRPMVKEPGRELGLDEVDAAAEDHGVEDLVGPGIGDGDLMGKTSG